MRFTLLLVSVTCLTNWAYGGRRALLREENLNVETNSQPEQLYISALYDHKKGEIYYKDELNEVCWKESFGPGGFNFQHIFIIYEHYKISTNSILNEEKVKDESLGKEFCGHYPIYNIKTEESFKDDEGTKLPNYQIKTKLSPVRRIKRATGNGNRQFYTNNPNNQNWPQQPYTQQGPGAASQSQIQGQVSGQGFFSGQAQSQLSGASQSQVQLSGTGIVGSVSSSAGTAQAQIALGERSGSGQAGSQGLGPSNSQVQLSLDDVGRGSMASASVLDNGQLTTGQRDWIPGSGLGYGLGHGVTNIQNGVQSGYSNGPAVSNGLNQNPAFVGRKYFIPNQGHQLPRDGQFPITPVFGNNDGQQYTQQSFPIQQHSALTPSSYQNGQLGHSTFRGTPQFPPMEPPGTSNFGGYTGRISGGGFEQPISHGDSQGGSSIGSSANGYQTERSYLPGTTYPNVERNEAAKINGYVHHGNGYTVTPAPRTAQSSTDLGYGDSGSTFGGGNYRGLPPQAFATSVNGGQAQAQTVYLGSGSSDFYHPNKAAIIHHSSSYPNGYTEAIRHRNTNNQYGSNGVINGVSSQYVPYDATLQHQRPRTQNAASVGSDTSNGSKNGYRVNGNRQTFYTNGQGTPSYHPTYSADNSKATIRDGYIPTSDGYVRPYISSNNGQSVGLNGFNNKSPGPITVLGPTPTAPAAEQNARNRFTVQHGTVVPMVRSENGDHITTTGPHSPVSSSLNVNGQNAFNSKTQRTGQRVNNINYAANRSPITAGTGVLEQDGLSPAYGISQVQPEDPTSTRCTIITFTCTIIFESNGRAKICKPNATQVNGNNQQSSSHIPQNSKNNSYDRQICCC